MGAKLSLRVEFTNPDLGSYGDQAAETLRQIAKLVPVRSGGNIRDANGNTIGSWKLGYA